MEQLQIVYLDRSAPVEPYRGWHTVNNVQWLDWLFKSIWGLCAYRDLDFSSFINMEPFYVFFFCCFKSGPINLCWLKEYCNTVLLWSSKNVWRTLKLHLTFHCYGGRQWVKLVICTTWGVPHNLVCGAVRNHCLPEQCSNCRIPKGINTHKSLGKSWQTSALPIYCGQVNQHAIVLSVWPLSEHRGKWKSCQL